MLAGGMSVKENDSVRDVKWNGKFRVFNGKGDIVIEGVVLNRNAIEPPGFTREWDKSNPS